MSPLDIVIVTVAVAGAVFGIVVAVRRKKQGKGCGGDCAACGGCCHYDTTDTKEKDT